MYGNEFEDVYKMVAILSRSVLKYGAYVRCG